MFTINNGNAIVLRASQVAALQSMTTDVLKLSPTTVLEVQKGAGDDSEEASASPSASGGYTAGEMAGVGLGVGLPLLIALLAAVFVIMRQRKRFQRERSHKQQVGEHRVHGRPGQAPAYVQYAPHNGHRHPPPGGRKQYVGELDSVDQVNEIDNAGQRQELPAGK